MRAESAGLVLALGVAAGACGDEWPALDPIDRPEVLDDRLGIEIDRTTSSYRIASTYGRDGVLVVYEDLDRGWHAVRVTPDGTITDLPAPDLQPKESITLARAFDPDGAVLVVSRDNEIEVQTLSNDRWQTLPAPPLTVSGVPDLSSISMHHGRVYLGAQQQLAIWSGSAWSMPISNGTSLPFYVGGYDAQTQWVFRWMPTTAWEAIPLDTNGTTGTPVRFPATPANAINGDASAFQVVGDQRLWQFSGGTFTSGDDAVGNAYTAPGSSRIVFGLEQGPLTFAQNAGTSGTALPSYVAHLDCECQADSSPTCGCVDHDVNYVSLRVSPSLDRVAFVMADAVAGYSVLTARFVALPATSDPFAP